MYIGGIIRRVLSFLVILFVIVAIGIKFFSWIHSIWNYFLLSMPSIKLIFGLGMFVVFVVGIFLTAGTGYLIIKFHDCIFFDFDDRILEFDEDKEAFKVLLIVVSIIFISLFFLVK